MECDGGVGWGGGVDRVRDSREELIPENMGWGCVWVVQ